MPKIVYAPILEQTGFLKRKALASLVNYVARLDGATQYWQLSEAIPLVGNFRVDIEMSADPSNQLPMKITDGQGLIESKRVDTNLVNYFFDPRDYMHVEVDGIETLEAPIDGRDFMLSLIRSDEDSNRVDKEIYILGARFTHSNHLKGYIKSIKVYEESGVLTHEIPLTNKAQGATQLATVGNVNATMVNYTEAVWEVLPEPEPINYVARLDGATQYWQLSEPVIIQGGENFELGVTFLAEKDSCFVLSNSESRYPTLYIRSDGKVVVEFLSGELLVSRESVVGPEVKLVIKRDGTTFSMDEVVRANSISKTISTDESLAFDTIGWRTGTNLRLPGYVKDIYLKSGSTLTHEIPLTNKAQGKFQVASTTPLGNNLYTQEVIENPFLASSQWSYLGEGRWFLDGQGDNSPIVFIQKSEQPQSGYVEFEIESITGGFLTCTSEFIAESRFDTAGVKTFYYENIDDIFEIQFKRSVGSVKTVIKNIKHYDADGVLIATLINYTEAVWEEV